MNLGRNFQAKLFPEGKHFFIIIFINFMFLFFKGKNFFDFYIVKPLKTPKKKQDNCVMYAISIFL